MSFDPFVWSMQQSQIAKRNRLQPSAETVLDDYERQQKTTLAEDIEAILSQNPRFKAATPGYSPESDYFCALTLRRVLDVLRGGK